MFPRGRDFPLSLCKVVTPPGRFYLASTFYSLRKTAPILLLTTFASRLKDKTGLFGHPRTVLNRTCVALVSLQHCFSRPQHKLPCLYSVAEPFELTNQPSAEGLLTKYPQKSHRPSALVLVVCVPQAFIVSWSHRRYWYVASY